MWNWCIIHYLLQRKKLLNGFVFQKHFPHLMGSINHRELMWRTAQKTISCQVEQKEKSDSSIGDSAMPSIRSTRFATSHYFSRQHQVQARTIRIKLTDRAAIFFSNPQTALTVTFIAASIACAQILILGQRRGSYCYGAETRRLRIFDRSCCGQRRRIFDRSCCDTAETRITGSCISGGCVGATQECRVNVTCLQ
mmetsp:Transcript_13982/g.14163  ORF Transcript_13982/g.14163 Transcript_13982/m.14163 type:complete len:195 (-) Transcript_13982:65-649(-)